ncbi:hypothetical protein BsWGS_17104 [Bradybaena similaris]
MADDSSERQGLHQSLRSQMGYGTAVLTAATRKTTPRTRRFISRHLLRSDTLMGIALKYGVTVQDLKKENKIWNNDHLFLRETILIPLTSENEAILDENDIIVVFDGTSSHTSSPSSSHSHLPNGEDAGSVSTSGTHPEVSAGTAVKARSMSTPSDFFSKYDSNIAQLKGDVAKMEQSAAGLEEVLDANPLPQRRDSASSIPSTNSPSQRRESSGPDEENIEAPVPQALPLSSNKQIKSAMENLEQISDDIYEL